MGAIVLVFTLVITRHNLVNINATFGVILINCAYRFFRGLLSPLIDNTFTREVILLTITIILVYFSDDLFFATGINIKTCSALTFVVARGAGIPVGIAQMVASMDIILVNLTMDNNLTTIFGKGFSRVGGVKVNAIVATFYANPLIAFFGGRISRGVLGIGCRHMNGSITCFFVGKTLLGGSLHPMAGVSSGGWTFPFVCRRFWYSRFTPGRTVTLRGFLPLEGAPPIGQQYFSFYSCGVFFGDYLFQGLHLHLGRLRRYRLWGVLGPVSRSSTRDSQPDLWWVYPSFPCCVQGRYGNQLLFYHTFRGWGAV